MFHKQKAFTIVELIVSISILAVLATIGFVSYTDYIAGSRDANRVSQIKDIYSGLQLYAANKKLPYPDDYVTIYASGTLLSYQGYAGEGVLKTINYGNGGKDPQDTEYFTYTTTKNRKSHQVLGFLEESELAVHVLPQSYAVDYSRRYPQSTGIDIGVILTNPTNTPIQETTTGNVDIVTSGNTYNVVFSDKDTLTASGGLLLSLSPTYNCERLAQIGEFSGNGYYNIQPEITKYRIYCDSSRFGKNLVEQNWTPGIGAQGKYTMYGPAANNERVYGITPTGSSEVLWQAIPDGALTVTDGGWYYNIKPISINPTKTYRSSLWMKKTGDTNGISYFGDAAGTTKILNLAGTVNGNPYFWSGDLPQIDKWYLLVGYIRTSTYSGIVSYGGIYDPVTGQKVVNGTDFKFDPTASIAWPRSFLNSDATTTNRQYWFDIRFEEIEEHLVGDVKDLLPLPVN